MVAAAVGLRCTVSLLLLFVVILLVHVLCDRCVNYISSPATLACLSMCCCSVMPATAASNVNVDRVSLNNGGNLLLVYFLLMASKVYELRILRCLILSAEGYGFHFHEADLILS